MSGALVLITRDLRVNYRQALSAAAREHEHVLALFVLDDALMAGSAGPRGDYVRRYVPELAAIPGASVHEPWLLPARERRALGYPERGLRAIAAGEARRHARRSG